MKYLKEIIASTVIIGFAGLAIHGAISHKNKLQVKDIQLKSTSSDLKDLQLQYEVLDKNLNTQLQKQDVDEAEVKKLQDEKVRLEKEKQDLQVQLQAKLDAKNKAQSAEKAIANAVLPTASAAVSNCGDNEYARYIYMKESGCRTTARNPQGCYGIGQSCPASKIAHCGSDYACQNAWFTGYAISRYGSWQKAYQFWLANHWW